MKERGEYLMCHIDKVLSVVPTKVTNCLDLVLAQGCVNERDDLMREEGTTC